MSARWFFSLLAVLSLALPARAEQAPAGLEIYFIDTEGGAATLIVTPQRESILIDCGNPGTRDAERIHAVATKQAKLEAIDHLFITHWHSDHYGGVGRLSKLLPINNYYDRGKPAMGNPDLGGFQTLMPAYRSASGDKSKTLKAGDEIALKQSASGPKVRLQCLCGNGQTIPDKKEAPENPVAKANKPKPVDTSDNANSLGFLLSYGDFRFLDLGDLTWNIEYKLVSPSDKIGLVDVYQVTHHGLELSNNPVLIETVQPRVAVFNNGPRKGGSAIVTSVLRRVPDIKAIYQMHRNVTVGAQENTDPEFIANMDERCQGESIHLSVAPDGKKYTFAVGSKSKTHTYETRAR